MSIHLEASLMTDAEAEKIFTALIDYCQIEVYSRMVAYGEPFEVALANYLEEISNEQMEKPPLR